MIASVSAKRRTGTAASAQGTFSTQERDPSCPVGEGRSAAQGCASMPYTVERLAPGSFDVRLDGKVVASLVAETNERSLRTTWHVELLDESDGGSRPAPFTRALHKFDSLGSACEWLSVERPA